MPAIVASEVRAAIATPPADALATVGVAVDVEVALTTTLFPLAVSVEPVTYALVVVWIVRFESAPAPVTPPRASAIAAATLAWW